MAPNAAYVLNPANASDGYGDWDEDGMNNLEEYQVAQIFGEGNFHLSLVGRHRPR